MRNSSLTIREMQIIIIIGYHYTPIAMAKRKHNNAKCCGGCRETGSTLHCWWECEIVRLFWKGFGSFLTKLNIQLLYDPAFALLDTYPREMEITFTQKPMQECL